jgi:DNA-binding beta-propeller fold protein YncE
MRTGRLLPIVLASLVVMGTLAVGVVPAGAATKYGDVCGVLGSPLFCTGGEFGTPIGVAVDNSIEPSAGDVYVADFGKGRVVRFDASGKELGEVAPSGEAVPFVNPMWDAVDPSNGDLYVTDYSAGTVSKFDPAGALVSGFATGGQITGLALPAGVAVDPTDGRLFVAQRGNPVIVEYDSSGKELGSFPAPVESTEDSLAVDGEGNVFEVDEKTRLVEYPAINREASIVLDTNAPFAVTIDPSTEHLYVTQNSGSGQEIAILAHDGTPISSFGLGAFSSTGSAGIAANSTTHTIYASDIENNLGLIFQEGEAPAVPATKPATEITGTSAILHGEIDPEGKEVGYYFSYNTNGNCTGEGATTTPLNNGEGPLTGNTPVEVSTSITGLQPSTHYTFCLFATNTFGASEGTAEPLTTSALAPSVDSQSASDPGNPTVSLSAQINPNNQETTYSFQYANNEELTGATTVPGGTLTGFGDQTASVNLGGGLAPGVYYYRTVAENATGTSYGSVQSFARVARPIVGETEAQDPTTSTVILSGSVNPQGLATTYRFEMVSEAAYKAAFAEGAEDPYATGPSTSTTSAGSDYTSHATGEVIAKELLPGTTYHYALLASNQDGTTIGLDGTFTTGQPTPPGATTGSANSVTQNTASITGTIDTQGLPTTYGFEIGLEANDYGPATGLGSVGAGATQAEVTLPLTGLQPGTTYHYRIMATNNDGTSYGADQVFTTGVFANAFVTPPAPLPFLTVQSIMFPPEAGSPIIKKKTIKKTTKKKPKKHKKSKGHGKPAKHKKTR